ncbi:MAG: DUF4421 domain-containing protein [Pseudoflavonifractor sp.]|nr:DUF4421 domain-containing protein [Pseudoflavonifractor sp.]
MKTDILLSRLSAVFSMIFIPVMMSAIAVCDSVCGIPGGEITLSGFVETDYVEVVEPVVAVDTTLLRPLKGNWVRQLIESGFRINDPRINYPKFARFCVKVYNWGDRTFNSYDPEYVVGTGKNWKIIGKSYNWAESYMLTFSSKSSIRMISDIYVDIGAHLCFMAVSVGYDLNANNMFGDPASSRSNFEFNFTCALFAANYRRASTKGGTRITKFGTYDLGHKGYFDFDGADQTGYGLDLYYFFNHRKYSQAAAYCYSKYQLKSAGSFIGGFNHSHQEINLDFSKLPDTILEHLPGDHKYYMFKHNDYDLMFGYAYNWVLKPRKWLINVTALPSVGYKHSYEGSTDGKKDMFSANIRGMFSVVYNNRSLFVSLSGRFDGHTYFGNGYDFFNSTESLTLNVGARF